MKKLSIIAALLFAATQISAQSVPFLNITSDPHAAAMGGNTLTIGENAFTATNNASAMAFSENKFRIAGSYNSWQPDYMDNSIIGFSGFATIGEKWAIGIGGKMFGYQSYEITDSYGTPKGEFSPKESAIEGAVAYRISEKLSVGANIRSISSELAKDGSASTMGADISLTYKAENFTLAAAATNLGGSIDYGTKTTYDLPSMVKFGGAYIFNVADEQNLSVNLEGDILMSDSAFMGSAALEYSLKNTFNLRAGYHMGNEEAIPSYASFGFGLNFKAFNIDAAYLMGGGENSVLSGSFGLAVGLKF